MVNHGEGADLHADRVNHQCVAAIMKADGITKPGRSYLPGMGLVENGGGPPVAAPAGSAQAPSGGPGWSVQRDGDGRRGGVGRDPGLRGEVLAVEGPHDEASALNLMAEPVHRATYARK